MSTRTDSRDGIQLFKLLGSIVSMWVAIFLFELYQKTIFVFYTAILEMFILCVSMHKPLNGTYSTIHIEISCNEKVDRFGYSIDFLFPVGSLDLIVLYSGWEMLLRFVS